MRLFLLYTGLLGEGGQYTLPEGEWFCTECYSSDNTSPDQNITSLSEKDIDGAEDSTATSADALYSRLSHQDLELAAAESLHIAPNRNPSSVLATIKSEYHTMRKERNRILAQWQQEKRIIEKYEISRRIEQQKRDQELVRAKETITQLESLVTQGEAQSTRMQKLFDIMLKELQQQNATFSATTNSSSSAASANTTAIRNSVDRLKWASLTVETLLDTPIERLADDDDSESASPSPHGKTSGGRSSIDGAGVPAGEGRPPVKKLQQSASSPSQLTIAHLYGNTGLSAATAQQESSSSGIPKPWKGGNKVRTGAPGQGDPAPSPAITAVTAAGAPDSSSSNRLKIENSPKERRQGPTLNTQANRHSDRGRILSGSPSSDFSKTQPAVVITPNSSSAGVNGGGNKEEQSAASSSSQLLRRHSSVTAETNSRSPTKEIHATHKAAGGAGAEVESGVGKSKFINPLKNRLRDLLLSVEAETDAFAEIRQKFKSRGDERNQLRNSHNAEN